LEDLVHTKNKTVLVVEDEALIACDLQYILETSGYRVIGPAASASGALGLIRDETPDLALLDADLGKTTSFELADTLLARNAKIIFLSGHSLKWFSDAHRNRRVLEKPFLPQDLVAAVEEEFGVGSDLSI
jgi:DNA-binding response OmpR family regulator